jgi:alpha-mannosidase
MLILGGDRNQFHDVLPGSSIGLVYEDAARHYAAVAAEGGSLLGSAMAAVLSVRRCERAYRAIVLVLGHLARLLVI